MPPDHFDALLDSALTDLSSRHLLRQRHALKILDATHLEFENRRYINLASNNYLGLTHHPALIEAARRATLEYGAGSAAAPLVTGHSELHAAAEAALARWKSTEDALLLPSGYQANHATVAAVASLAASQSKPIRFLFDKLVHASLIDATRATAAAYRVFPHNGIPKLERLLAEADPAELQVVVTESIFSMDGDAADLPALADLKRRYPFLLILDEAHASGVYGPAGSGLAAELHLSHLPDLTVVTLSKALGSIGGVICSSKKWCDTITNFARPYLFSTAVPPSVPATALAALDVLHHEPHHQQRVRTLARSLRQQFNLGNSDSPIIPIVLGDEQTALTASDHLKQQGFWIPAIRPPTVPPGSSRLRVTLSSAHTDEEIAALIEALLRLQPRSGDRMLPLAQARGNELDETEAP